MIVPNMNAASSTEILNRLANEMASMTPELRKAASFLLDHPNEVGVTSMRKLAVAAKVKPNTFVRLARHLGFAGYPQFCQPFRDDIRQGRDTFPDRARWLQALGKGGQLDSLFAEMASSSLGNIEQLFGGFDVETLKTAARDIANARHTFILGVGIANPLARNFAYLADMAVDSISAIPDDGVTPLDGLLRAKRDDILIAMTFKPYRREVLEAVRVAQAMGLRVIGLSDSAAAPHLAGVLHRFIVPTRSPQFFTSTIALSAFLETLIAFVIAEAGDEAIANIEAVHLKREKHGLYVDERDAWV